MKISVITATRNRKKFLPEAVSSVQKSILTPLTNVSIEHIIYDDASTDGTEALFTRSTPANVKFFRSASRIGQSRARNEAVKRSTGEYLFILDDDDLVLQRSLYHFACSASRYPKTQWFTADFLRVDEKLSYLPGEDYYGWDFDSPEAMLDSIFRGEHFMQHNMLFAKDLFDQVGGFDEHLLMAEDLDLCIRFLKAGHMPRYGSYISHLHRYHGTNVSRGVTPRHHLRTIAELKKKYTDT